MAVANPPCILPDPWLPVVLSVYLGLSTCLITLELVYHLTFLPPMTLYIACHYPASFHSRAILGFERFFFFFLNRLSSSIPAENCHALQNF